MTNHDVVKKLIGPIDPVGESNADAKRFENLEEMIGLVDALLKDIGDVARYNKSRVEYSMKKAGDCAHSFLKAWNVNY